MKRKIALPLLALIAASGIAYFLHTNDPKDIANVQVQTETAPEAKAESKPQPSFDKKKLSIDDSNSLWVVVNKKRSMQPASYKPSDLVMPKVPQRVPGNESMQLRSEAAKAVEKMFADAQGTGLKPEISSAYRSYNFQITLYGDYVRKQGVASADTQSARPGHSEHQTGLALDIQPEDGKCHLEACFADLPEGKWLAENAHKYGFTMRYLKDKQNVTGYIYEPWHYRYVGIELATEIHKQGQVTLEEFFGLPNADKYD